LFLLGTQTHAFTELHTACVFREKQPVLFLTGLEREAVEPIDLDLETVVVVVTLDLVLVIVASEPAPLRSHLLKRTL